MVLSNDFSEKRFCKVKTNGIINRKLVIYKKYDTFCHFFFCTSYKFRKWEIKIKALKTFLSEKKMLFISIDIRKPPMLGSNNLQQPTDKADSTT